MINVVEIKSGSDKELQWSFEFVMARLNDMTSKSFIDIKAAQYNLDLLKAYKSEFRDRMLIKGAETYKRHRNG